MPDLWSDLLACLDLRPIPTDDDRDTVVFTGPNQSLGYYRIFGGQLLGQFVRAAQLACPDKTVKSVHALFPREGKPEEELRYRVQIHRQGRTFAALGVVAEQASGPVATASISMHAPDSGPEQQATAPVGALLSAEYKAGFDIIPWETRTDVDLDDTGSAPAEFEFWMRSPAAGEQLAPALTAYATDLTLIGTALRPLEGVCQRGNGTAFHSAVTSHTLWFHRPFRTDDWLLLRQHSPAMAQGRCFGRGDVFTESGELVASFAQEATVRFPEH
ncbi:acyl-CoA thioesterase [Nocardia vermiculata]|uniref:Acyl-CoA thioesterase II n=1 Tax=Nocardia vermiculata TaxID=257274 RepID=A0A846XWK2_9NOCA|nr:acyl-CoA thioesterase domain-containing protein [Nocardia vermiculata]NKY51007.1 acyl-CoA thioesterase II [Nocardia vermiculata]